MKDNRPKPARQRRGRKPMVVKIDDTPENVARAVMGVKRKPTKKANDGLTHRKN